METGRIDSVLMEEQRLYIKLYLKICVRHLIKLNTDDVVPDENKWSAVHLKDYLPINPSML